jgi:hypothetical protein
MAAATDAISSLVPVQPVFTDAERLALAGFLAGYRGLTREAYTLDLRQFTGWCRARSLPLFSVRRADIPPTSADAPGGVGEHDISDAVTSVRIALVKVPPATLSAASRGKRTLQHVSVPTAGSQRMQTQRGYALPTT